MVEGWCLVLEAVEKEIDAQRLMEEALERQNDARCPIVVHLHLTSFRAPQIVLGEGLHDGLEPE